MCYKHPIYYYNYYFKLLSFISMKNKKNKDLILINFFSNDLPFFLQFEFLIYIIFLLTEEFLLTYLVKEMKRFLNLFRFRRVSEEFHLTYVVKQVCQCINSISVWLSEEFFIFAPLWRILLLNTEFSAGSIFSFNALIFTQLTSYLRSFWWDSWWLLPLFL